MPSLADLRAASSEAVHFANAEALSTLLPELKKHSSVFELGTRFTDRAGLFRELAKLLSFPEHFGSNWDAVVDCLRDLPEHDAGRGVILTVSHALQVWRETPHIAGELVQVWLDVAEEWRRDGLPFHLVFVW